MDGMSSFSRSYFKASTKTTPQNWKQFFWNVFWTFKRSGSESDAYWSTVHSVNGSRWSCLIHTERYWVESWSWIFARHL
ncbi:unnamed protein product [Bathycoccus prasinos]